MLRHQYHDYSIYVHYFSVSIVKVSPGRPQHLTFTDHPLTFTNLYFTFYLKLFLLAYFLTQANETGNHPSGDNCPEKTSHWPTPLRPFELKP